MLNYDTYNKANTKNIVKKLFNNIIINYLYIFKIIIKHMNKHLYNI